MIGAGDFRAVIDAFPVVLVPLARRVFLIAGLRYLFSLPSELRANWIFQIAESEGRVVLAARRGPLRHRLRTGARLCCAAFPPPSRYSASWQALRVTVLGFFLALLVFEFLFRDWHKAPFTCSYLPGKRQMWQVLVSRLRMRSPTSARRRSCIRAFRCWLGDLRRRLSRCCSAPGAGCDNAAPPPGPKPRCSMTTCRSPKCRPSNRLRTRVSWHFAARRRQSPCPYHAVLGFAPEVETAATPRPSSAPPDSSRISATACASSARTSASPPPSSPLWRSASA